MKLIKKRHFEIRNFKQSLHVNDKISIRYENSIIFKKY